MNMESKFEKVDSLVYIRPISDEETIADQLRMSELEKDMRGFSYYLRAPEDCPYNRGNWIVDIEFNDGAAVFLKYPREMTKERFEKFIKPLKDLYNSKGN